MKHPYSGLPAYHFWTHGVAATPYGELDFLPRPKFNLHGCTKIATAGSCFAQNIARHLKQSGTSFFDAEPAHPILDAEYAARNGYGVFSARFGNIYTVRQLVELMRQAFGVIPPIYDFSGENGLFFDLLRPSVQQDGFSCREEAAADRDYHLSRVKFMFETCDVFVFTLGLTETWFHAKHDYAYPACPGTSHGVYDPQVHHFKNLSVAECQEDLAVAIDLLARINPRCKIMLTVSPVGLSATYENQNVLIATTHSKSVLRAVCGEAERRYGHLLYFPSFEIISSACSYGQYLGADMREANARGVQHVMHYFARSLYPNGVAKPESLQPATPPAAVADNNSFALGAKLVQADCDELYNNPGIRRN